MRPGKGLGRDIDHFTTILKGLVAPGLEQGVEHMVHPLAARSKGFVEGVKLDFPITQARNKAEPAVAEQIHNLSLIHI